MTPTPKIYIAVIDDDESFCRSTARLLRAAGYHPVTYASAESFLADSKHPRFDCLLLDIALDGISGVDLAGRLAEVGSRTPVIFITAHTDPATRQRALATGCAAFIGKFEPTSLLLESIAKSLAGNLPPGKTGD